jgi:opacity protein-like surface antigen
MKRITLAVLLIAITAGSAAAQVQLGLRTGAHSIFDSAIKETYGNGWIFVPFVRITSKRTQLAVEFSYEGGYNQSAPVGLYDEMSRLKLYGLEVSAYAWYRFGMAVPYLKMGIGYYFYRQEIDSEFVDKKVQGSDQRLLFAAGLDINLPKGFYLTGEVKVVPWLVAPFDVEVELGGLRYLVGIGYGFDLQFKKNVKDID